MKKKINGQKEFNEYLEQISLEGNPFSCPNLRVLQEDVNFRDNIIGGRDYSKGTLICKKSSGGSPYALLYHNCYVIGNVLQREGKTKVGCNCYGILEIEIKSVTF